jgi:hypothetical protein
MRQVMLWVVLAGALLFEKPGARRAPKMSGYVVDQSVGFAWDVIVLNAAPFNSQHSTVILSQSSQWIGEPTGELSIVLQLWLSYLMVSHFRQWDNRSPRRMVRRTKDVH